MAGFDLIRCGACGRFENWQEGAPGESMPCASCGQPIEVPMDPPPHPIPWEDRRRNPFKRWWQTWDQALFKPHLFFPNIPYDGGHRAPLKFVAFFYIQLFGALALFLPLQSILTGRADRAWIGAALAIVAGPFLCGFLIAILYLFSAIDHACLRLLGGKGSFEATLRVVAYSYPTVFFRSLPYVGRFLHPIWSLICFTFGFAAAHRISKTRAFFAALLGAALTFTLVFWVGLMAALLLPSLKKIGSP